MWLCPTHPTHLAVNALEQPTTDFHYCHSLESSIIIYHDSSIFINIHHIHSYPTFFRSNAVLILSMMSSPHPHHLNHLDPLVPSSPHPICAHHLWNWLCESVGGVILTKYLDLYRLGSMISPELRIPEMIEKIVRFSSSHAILSQVLFRISQFQGSIVYNVKLGLINPAVVINPLCPPKKCNLKKRWSPRINKSSGWDMINQHPVLKSIFYPTMFISNSIYFQVFFTFFYHHCYT